jgi:hypothetical protein
MTFFRWCRLLLLEQKLRFEFGKYNKYLRLCVERRAVNAVDKLPIAMEVWKGPGVNSLEAQAHEIYLQKAKKASSLVSGAKRPTQKSTSRLVLRLWRIVPSKGLGKDRPSGIPHEHAQ